MVWRGWVGQRCAVRSAAVAAQAAGTLNDTVDGCQVGDEQIEVNVERLFDHLRGDEQPAGTLFSGAVFAKGAQHAGFHVQPVAQRKAGVEQQQVFGRQHSLELRKRGQRIGHRVADPADALARCECLCDGGDDFGCIAGAVHRHAALHVRPGGDFFLRQRCGLARWP